MGHGCGAVLGGLTAEADGRCLFAGEKNRRYDSAFAATTMSPSVFHASTSLSWNWAPTKRSSSATTAHSANPVMSKSSSMDRVIYDLKNNPFSRRIMTNIYVHQDLHEMNLYPCAYSMTFNVTQKKGDDRLTLNGILNQRSQDVLAANNWNVCQYAVLMHMLAQVCDMRVGELVHVIADAHIYDRHVPIVKELIERPQYDAPKFWLNPDIKDFYQFTTDDIKITDYVTGEQIKDIPIAV